MIRFDHPWALVWLLLVPLLWRARGARSLRYALPLRAGAIALTVLALAGPYGVGPSQRMNVVFVVDRSDSLSPTQLLQAERFIQEAARAHRPGDRLGLVSFAGEAVVEQAPSETFEVRPKLRPHPMDTDIGGAIERALEVLPQDGGRRIVLLSDGQDHGGRALRSARLARAAGVAVWVVPLLRPPSPEAWVEEVIAPEEVRAGERFRVEVMVRSSHRQWAQVDLLANAGAVGTRRVELAPGRSVVRFQVQGTEGWLRLRARIRPEADAIPENNAAEAFVRVRGAPEVLYVGSGDLAPLLRAQGMRVDVIPPERLIAVPSGLAGYDAVILDDVPAFRLNRAQMGSLREYVATLGGGLVVVGGPHAYGVGGYGRTALEEVLPVSMDIRHRVGLPTMAMVLVIDTSASMAGISTEPAKVELAKETAQSALDFLSERDLVGVIAFDQEYRWIVPLVPARERRRVQDLLSRLRAGGGTDMLPALRAAAQALSGIQAKVKHVVVLSDGQTDPGDFQGLARRMRAQRITLSTVSVGKDADVKFMRQLAEWAGGRHYLALDASSLPQILAAEALVATRAYLVEEVFTPRQAPSALLTGIPHPPALRGYVATSPKPAAQVHLSSPYRDPILATWQYGLGRAVAFTSDGGARWAVDWQRWPHLARFWSRVVRWAMGPAQEVLDVHAALKGTELQVAVDARDTSGEFLDGLEVEALLVGGSRTRFPLRQTGPGWYEGRVRLQAPGSYALSVVARHAQRPLGQRTVPVVLPYSPELLDGGGDPALLARIAEITGGRVVHSPQEALQRDPAARSSRPVWELLASLATALFLMEVVLRRLPALREAVAALVRGWRREEGEWDRVYEEADRWRVPDEEARRDASTEELARLYIARLKQQSRRE